MAEKKKGFAAMEPEERRQLIKKGQERSLETRRKKKLAKEQAEKLRSEAKELSKQVESLLQEADSLDGGCSSEKSKRKSDEYLWESIQERFKDFVDTRYMKNMFEFAKSRNLLAEDLVTPTHTAMDIQMDPNATNKEKQDALKVLEKFENSKPVAKDSDNMDTIGSAQEEFDKLLAKAKESSPKR